MAKNQEDLPHGKSFCIFSNLQFHGIVSLDFGVAQKKIYELKCLILCFVVVVVVYLNISHGLEY